MRLLIVMAVVCGGVVRSSACGGAQYCCVPNGPEKATCRLVLPDGGLDTTEIVVPTGADK